MKTIGAFEAKTHLSSLLDEVEAGEEVIITKRGRPVARLCSIAPARSGRRPLGIWKNPTSLPDAGAWAKADAEILDDFDASEAKPL